MLSRFGIEASQATQYIVAFVVILALLGLFGLVLRRLTSARLMLPGQDRGRSRQPRLGVVDIYDLDRQRQLILLRRDNVEHLLLIGGPNDVVIETNIVRVQPARNSASPAEAGAERAEPIFEPVAPVRPTVEPAARPALDSVTARLAAVARPSEKALERPAERPSELSDAAEELSPVGAIPPTPTPARSEPLLKPDTVTIAPVPGPAPLRAPPPRPEPRAAPAPTPIRPRPPEPPAPARPQPEPSTAPVRTPVAAPPAGAPRDARGPDAALLNDMARQLEEALRRPATPVGAPSGVPAVPGTPLPRASEPKRDGPQPPLRTTISPEPPRPVPPPPFATAPLTTLPLPTPPVAPVPAAATPPAPQPVPVPGASNGDDGPKAQESPASPEAPPAPPAPAPARAAPDPFSVEDIEAEFARLLGRPTDKT